MDMSDTSSDSCSISMLWNWTTVNSCFLASSWHVRTKAQFGGTVIGVFLLVIANEAVRRFGRDFDRRLVMDARARNALQGVSVNKSGEEIPYVFTPAWGQQLFRSIVYGSQFTASFLVMLLGMYFNGYILFAIFVGQTVGYFIFGRDTVCGGEGGGESGSCC